MRARPGTLLLACALVLGADVACGSRSQSHWEKEAQEMLPALERLANLEAKRPPVIQETDHQHLRSYLLERVEEVYPGDLLERMSRAYVWLGLLPDTLDLRSLLVGLYEEQALGFYDPKRDVLYVRRDAPRDALTAILAHELVHALQDQHVDLEALVRSREHNDRHTAAQAAIEGHATLVMYAWQTEAATGQPLSFDQLPDLGPLLEQTTALSTGQMPVYAASPRFIQESLLFPYTSGTEFVQRLWRRNGDRPRPFGSRLPTTTEQVLHGLEAGPGTALRVGRAPAGWTLVYDNDLGEFEMRLFLQAHVAVGGQARAAAGWAGDRYAILAGPSGTDTAFVWATVWDSEVDAAEFEAAYREAFHSRFGGAAGGASDLVGQDAWAGVEEIRIGGRPGRRFTEARRPLHAAALSDLQFRVE